MYITYWYIMFIVVVFVVVRQVMGANPPLVSSYDITLLLAISTTPVPLGHTTYQTCLLWLPVIRLITLATGYYNTSFSCIFPNQSMCPSVCVCVCACVHVCSVY